MPYAKLEAPDGSDNLVFEKKGINSHTIPWARMKCNRIFYPRIMKVTPYLSLYYWNVIIRDRSA